MLAHLSASLRTPREMFAAAAFAAAGSMGLGPLSLTVTDDWIALEASGEETRHLPQFSLGQPGLWKPAADGSYRFEIPTRVFSEAAATPDDGPAHDGLAGAVIDWARSTLAGDLPAGWQAPDSQLVHSWLASEEMTIRSGALVRPIEVVHAPDRLALRCVLVTEVGTTLSRARRAWIEHSLAFAQHQWRVVRFGLGTTGTTCLIAVETDLTGCPAALGEPLVTAALAALRAVAAHEIVLFFALSNPSVISEVWEVFPE